MIKYALIGLGVEIRTGISTIGSWWTNRVVLEKFLILSTILCALAGGFLLYSFNGSVPIQIITWFLGAFAGAVLGLFCIVWSIVAINYVLKTWNKLVNLGKEHADKI